jgi:hypothetical protein
MTNVAIVTPAQLIHIGIGRDVFTKLLATAQINQITPSTMATYAGYKVVFHMSLYTSTMLVLKSSIMSIDVSSFIISLLDTFAKNCCNK